MQEIQITDSNKKEYLFTINKLPAVKWFELFEKLLKFLDHAETDGENLKKIMHVLAQTGAYTKEDVNIEIDDLKSTNIQELMTTIFSVLKSSLLKSSFEDHIEIYNILFSSMFWENTPVNFHIFDQFENRFLFYEVMMKALGVHFDFLHKLQNLQKSQQ
ncbi:MAG: hypothetical protein ACRC31_06235 [Cetobacterium sp.]